MRDGEVVPLIPAGAGIPRIVHATYATRSLPERLAENSEHIRRLNPGWQYRFYDNADAEAFIGAAYGQAMLDRYATIAPEYGAARADLFRYLVMYHTGGVYLDIKSSASHPFDAVLLPDDRFIVSQWRNRRGEIHNGWGLHPELWSVPGGEFQQWFIAAAPGHPFLRAVIGRVLRNMERYGILRDGVGFPSVVRVTGPIAYTQAIAPLLRHHPHRRIANESTLALHYSVLEGQSHRQLFAGHYDRRRTPLIRTATTALPPRVLPWLQDVRALARRLAVSGPRPLFEALEALGLRSRGGAPD